MKINEDRLNEILGKFENTSIVVIGDLMLDEYIWGNVDRISPEAPVPVIDVVKEEKRLGGAGNVSTNLSALGARVSVASVIGSDVSGTKVLEMLENDGINNSIIEIDTKRKTSTKTRIMAHSQQIARVDREDRHPISEDKALSLIHRIEDMKIPDVIVISDYNKGVVTKELMKEIMHYSKLHSVPVIVDPKVDFGLYSGCTCITPNLKEFEVATGYKCDSEDSISSYGKQLMNRLNLPMLLITKSEKGMSILEGGPEEDRIKVSHLPTAAKIVYDVCGAGDVSIAVFSLCIVCGATPRESAVIANIAAGISVTMIGAVAVTTNQIINEMKCLS